MRLNTQPENRADMVRAISETLGKPAVYLRAPTYGYTIDSITVNRDGTIDCDDSDAIAAIRPILLEHGWLSESLPGNGAKMSETDSEASAPEADDAAATGTDDEIPAAEPTSEETQAENPQQIDGYRINIPMQIYTPATMANLIRMLYSRQLLLNRMLRSEALHIDDEVITLLRDTAPATAADLEATLQNENRLGMLQGIELFDGKAVFTLAYDAERPTLWNDYSDLAAAIVRLTQTSARVKSEKLVPTDENEKYMANTWLNRLGFGGPEYKALRYHFLAHLKGYAAFKDGGRMQAHRDRYSAIRAGRHDSAADSEAPTEIAGEEGTADERTEP